MVEAISWINKLSEISGTNISGALDRAFKISDDLEAIYFVSDGFPNSGITNED